MYMREKQSHTYFLHDFLIHPRYRVWRHVALVFVMFVIALNQAGVMLEEYFPKLENELFLPVAAAITVSYLAAIYYNLYRLVPNLLFTGKYTRYLVSVGVSVVLLILVLDVIEYGTYAINGISINQSEVFSLSSESSLFLDLILSAPLIFISITGGTMVLLLKQWGIESENILKLKSSYLETEVEQLKERISPDFLFCILNKAGHISTDSPEEASVVLAKLSRILRYQLYDCVRETVLLGSDINFIENYLDLYQSYNEDFSYRLTVGKGMKPTFLPPLLFLPLVQLMIKGIEKGATLCISFAITGGFIEFVCSSAEREIRTTEANDLHNLHRRLVYLYNESYDLKINNSQIVLRLIEKQWR